MIKKQFQKIVACLIMIIILGTPISVYAEEGRYDAEYVEVNTILYSNMGVYNPGTYIISSSNLPDASSNILDVMSFVCNIPVVGDIISGCEYVEWGERFLAVLPDVTL